MRIGVTNVRRKDGRRRGKKERRRETKAAQEKKDETEFRPLSPLCLGNSMANLFSSLNDLASAYK
jgi:hypothetical protein